MTIENQTHDLEASVMLTGGPDRKPTTPAERSEFALGELLRASEARGRAEFDSANLALRRARLFRDIEPRVARRHAWLGSQRVAVAAGIAGLAIGVLFSAGPGRTLLGTSSDADLRAAVIAPLVTSVPRSTDSEALISYSVKTSRPTEVTVSLLRDLLAVPVAVDARSVPNEGSVLAFEVPTPPPTRLTELGHHLGFPIEPGRTVRLVVQKKAPTN
jgi:hypothetical protein